MGNNIKNYEEKKTDRQFWLSVALIIFGCCLLMMGFWVDPMGVISGGVLTAFGEISTLVAAILGIDAVYKDRLNKYVQELKEDKQENED